jgi:hypothetical protein
MKTLEWFKGRGGNLFADDNDRQYRIDTRGEPMPFGMKLYHLSVNDSCLGGAGSIEQCKSMAGRHAAKGKF